MPGSVRRREGSVFVVMTIAGWTNKIIRVGYVVKELVLAWMPWRPRYRVLAGDHPGGRQGLERWFRRTGHEIAFGKFDDATVGRYDVLVPLVIEDVRRLVACRGAAARNLLPVSSGVVVDLCDDKLAFWHFARERGFGEYTPRMAGEGEWPCVLKARRGFGGVGTWFAGSREEEVLLREGVVGAGEWFRQAVVPGAVEYATHVLFLGGRVVRSLTFEYDMGASGKVKGKDGPVRQRMMRSRHDEVFERILSAMGYEGLCCIDYKVEGGVPKVMEINPRIGSSLLPYFFSYLRSLSREGAARGRAGGVGSAGDAAGAGGDG